MKIESAQPRIGACLTAGIVAAILLAPMASIADTLVFRDVRIFDGEKVIDRGTVVVRDEQIEIVGPAVEIVAGARVIDGAGHTLLPGLIDAHTHVFPASVLEQSLVFGVTTELDMFMDPGSAARTKTRQAAGEDLDTADLRSAGTLVTAPGGHGTEYGVVIPTLDAPEKAQAFVDARIAEGSDYIKIVYDDGRAYGIDFPTLDRKTLTAVIAAAHARDKMAVVHIGTLDAARDALQAGADGLVHAFLDRRADDAFVELAVRSGAFVTATLTVLESVAGGSGGAELTRDANLAPYLTAANVQNLARSFPIREESLDLGVALSTVGRLAAAGVPVLAGTDAPNPGTAHGVSIHRELELLVDSGLTPVQALAAATSVPANEFGLEDRGRIAAGKRADLVLVKGNPARDIRDTRAIVGVWKRGARMDRDAYRAAIPPPAGEARTAKESLEAVGGLVSDFEGDALATGFGAGWQVSTDSFVGGSSTAELQVVPGGAGGSKGALAVTGEIEARPQPRWAGAMFYPGAGPMMPADLSHKKRIRFWARGDGKTYSIMLFDQSRGFTPAMKTFVAGDTWQEQVFPIGDFDGLEGKSLTGVFFGGGAVEGAFELRLDDVRFD